MSVVAIAEHRASNGRFAPGRSGNPAGRPKGARNKMTRLAEAVLEENGEGLARKAVADALGGDGATMRFLIGRFCPPAGGEQPIELGLAPGEERDPDAILTKTVRAMADGEITPRQALQVGRLVAIIARLKKTMRAAEESKRPLPNPPPQVGEGARVAPEPSPARGGGRGGGEGGGIAALPASRPVSDQYFSAGNASRAPRSALYSTTAIGLAPGMAALRGAESPRPLLPI